MFQGAVYYDDYTGSDNNPPGGDGIGDTPYDLPGSEPDDEYPLANTSDNYSLQAWWLHSDNKMYRDYMIKPVGSVTINGGSSKIWIADQATLMDISFSGDDTWTGQVVFSSAPTGGGSPHTFTVEIGSSTNGIDFTVSGSDEYATLTGDGSKTVFTYEINASAFTVTTGGYLALKITNNNSGSDYDVVTGGAWSYTSSPETSTDYSLPVELSSFTATAGDGQVTLKWVTESEIDNLGFYVYRALTEDGEYERLTAELIEGAGNTSTQQTYSFTNIRLTNGVTYWYRLQDVAFDGTRTMHGPISVTPQAEVAVEVQALPTEFGLSQNAPNPFNPQTTIAYQLPEASEVRLTVHNTAGQLVQVLVDAHREAGHYTAIWDARGLGSGIYLYRLEAGTFIRTRKMVKIE